MIKTGNAGKKAQHMLVSSLGCWYPILIVSEQDYRLGLHGGTCDSCILGIKHDPVNRETFLEQH